MKTDKQIYDLTIRLSDVVVRFESITWLKKDFDDECYEKLKDITLLSDNLHNRLLVFYKINDKYCYRKKRKFKDAIDDLKEITQDIKDIFFQNI